jgi:O-antigen/teichoic acid export membrane protein
LSEAVPQIETAAPSAPAAAVPLRERALIGHSAMYLFGRAIPAALVLLSVPVFVRLLGIGTFGHFVLASSTALMIGNAAAAWLAQAVLRFAYGLQRSTGAGYAHALLRGNQASALTAGVGTFLIALLLPVGLSAALAAAVLAATTVLYGVAFAHEQALMHVRRANLAEILRAVLTVGIPLTAMTLPELRTPAVLLAGAAAGNLLAFWLLRRSVSSPGGGTAATPAAGADPDLLRQFWRFGGPLAAWMLVATLLNVSDRYLIGWMLDAEAVGTYGAVYDVVFKSLTFLMTPVVLAAHPVLMAAWTEGREADAERMLRRTQAALLGGGIGLTAVLFLASDAVSTFVLGQADGAAAAVIPWVAAGAAAWQLAMLTHKPLELRQKTGAMLVAVLGALALNVGVNLYAIPRWGVVAAAVSTFVGAVFYCAAVRLIVSSERRSRMQPVPGEGA